VFTFADEVAFGAEFLHKPSINYAGIKSNKKLRIKSSLCGGGQQYSLLRVGDLAPYGYELVCAEKKLSTGCGQAVE